MTSPPAPVSALSICVMAALAMPYSPTGGVPLASVIGHLHARTVAPDGAAVQQVPGLPAQPVDERGRGVEGEADEVDDDVRSQVGDAAGNGAVAVLRCPIGDDLAHLLPGGIVDVARPLSRG